MIPGRKGRERLTHRDHCFRPGIMRFSHWFSSSARPHDWCKAASVGHNGDVHGPLIVSAGPRYARWRQTMKRRTIFSVKPRKAIRTGTARAFCETLERRELLSCYALSQTGVFGGNCRGAHPQSAIAVDSIRHLYGTASRGGASGDGTIFEIAKGSGTITTLASFNGTNGANTEAGVTLDASGNLYGTTFNGGSSNAGTVFEIAKGSGTITTLVSFDGSNGANPSAGVTLDAAGDLYGTTDGGGDSNDGTVFEIAKGSGTITTLASFIFANGNAVAGVALDASGNLYGTTYDGGGSGSDGTVFEIAKGSGTIKTIASFNGTNGAGPLAGVTLDASGNLYGTTVDGGDSNDGTVFEIAKGSGTITTLASFNLTNGANPSAGVALDASGNLYGTTNEGTVFKIAKGSGTITTLIANGASILGGVTLDASGNLYGTTDIGGTSNDGTVFEIAKGLSTTRTLASFNGTNGEDPQAGVTLDASGNLYGTTELGGDGNGDGTVFEIAKGSGAVTTLAAFNLANGQNPASELTLDASGNLYGTAINGGSSGDGTVFEIAKGSATIATLASFNGTNGKGPDVGVTLDAAGNLYGTTYGGGISSAGTVFEIAKGSSTIKTIATFNGTNGANPWAGVTLDASGNLYGTTYFGGANGDGTVFRLTPDVPPTLVRPVAISDSSLTTANQTQRSEVRNLTVTFSQPVTLGGNPFTLQRLNTGGSGANDNSAPTDASAALGTPASSDGGITWSIPVLANTPFSDATGSLRDGTYTLNIHGASVTSTSTGTPMALDSSITFHRLFGDYDGNGIANNADYRQFVRSFLATRDSPSYSALFDYDGNGTIDLSDYRQFKLRYGKQLM